MTFKERNDIIIYAEEVSEESSNMCLCEYSADEKEQATEAEGTQIGARPVITDTLANSQASTSQQQLNLEEVTNI